MILKTCFIVCLLALLLTGCGGKTTMETISDQLVYSVMATPRSVAVHLPEQAAIPALSTDTQQIYQCETYEITLENLEAGDLGKTIRTISGFDREDLTVLKTRQGAADRYEFVWACAGEKGERLGRAAILDDGSGHYCLWVLRDAEEDGVDWDGVFASFCLAEGFIRTD